MVGSSPREFRTNAGALEAVFGDGVAVVVPWPAPSAEWRPVHGTAVPCRPAFRLVYPGGREPAAALAEFRRAMPEEIARILEPHTSHQWGLLELLAARPEAVQLAAHNPVLAYLLANNDHFRRILTKPPLYLATWRLDYTQKRLLEWLGFRGTQATVRLMRKIVPGALTPESARLLRNALNESPQVPELLAHVRRINRPVIGLVVNSRLVPVLTPKLMAETAELGELPPELEPANRLLAALSSLVAMGGEPKLRPLAKLHDIDRFSARVAKYPEERKFDLQVYKAKWPPPEGTADIVRLMTREDVIREGRDQANCVGARATAVVAGRTFIYRVLQPERATLEIIRSPRTGRWTIAEVKAHRNRSVSDTTLRHIQAWLARRETEFLKEFRKGDPGRKSPVIEKIDDGVPF